MAYALTGCQRLDFCTNTPLPFPPSHHPHLICTLSSLFHALFNSCPWRVGSCDPAQSCSHAGTKGLTPAQPLARDSTRPAHRLFSVREQVRQRSARRRREHAAPFQFIVQYSYGIIVKVKDASIHRSSFICLPVLMLAKSGHRGCRCALPCVNCQARPLHRVRRSKARHNHRWRSGF